MKKFVLSLILLVSLIGAAFAENIFAHRFFEVKLDVPIAVSNNLMGLTKILQKEVVIDLPKIADSVKQDKGASIKAEAYPSLSINLDIPRGLILGVNVGADADVSFGLSPEIFQFIGHGNVGMDNNFTQGLKDTYVDIFAHASLTGGWNGKKNRVAVTGTLFCPVAHLDAGDTYIQVYNNADKNEYGVKANVDAKMYSMVDVNNGLDDIQAILNEAKGGMGFDISADVQRDLFRFLTVGANAQIPIVPGKLGMLASVQYDFDYSINIDDMLKNASQEGQGESSSEGSATQSEEQQTPTTPELTEFVKLAKPYEIHRPLKLGASANFHPFGTLLTTSGYLGIGVRHPFASDNSTDFYVDYSIAGKLSLWNVINLELSHSCMDQVFKNEIALALNIRLVEVDAGVSFQSANFAKSFEGAGFGAYVTVCIGF